MEGRASRPPDGRHVSFQVGDLVVVQNEPDLGVGRVERFLDVDGVASVRVWLYASSRFVIRKRDDVIACPPNTPVDPSARSS